jgi:hypothetical protein
LIVRRLFIVAVALLIAAQVVRNAAVSALAPLKPEAAANLWRGHPAVETSLGLAAIGSASRERKPIPASAFAMINDAAAKAPLSPAPYLVRGVQARGEGDDAAALRAFAAAQMRDPRSLPAAYFLADHYFRSGEPLQGLVQATVLARLSPDGSRALAPFVADFAQDRSNWPALRELFRTQQTIEDEVLAVLAANPRNADAIAAVADATHRKQDSPWLPLLLRSLVESGDYTRALHFWSTFGRGRTGALIYDGDFAAPGPPPPFNWSLTSSTVGLAERQPGKRLHVIFYGNEDGVLASQLLLLPAGTYRLAMRIAGSPVHPEALRWSVRCAGGKDELAITGIDQAAQGGFAFQVPENCPAQWLELSGRSGDVAQQSEATITALTLSPAGSHA